MLVVYHTDFEVQSWHNLFEEKKLCIPFYSSSAGIAGLPLNLMADSEVPRSLAKPSAAKVALAINEAVQGDNHEIKQEIVESMLQDSMKKLMDTSSAVDAWRQFHSIML